MEVVVHNLYQEVTKTIAGAPQHVEEELLRMFPWLRSEDPEDQNDLPSLVDHINTMQGFEAEITSYESMAKAEAPNLQRDGENHVVHAMLGYNRTFLNALDAAKWLAGGAPRSLDQVRQALWEADGEPEEAALLAYGLEATPTNLKALRAYQGISSVRKAQPEPAEALSVEAGHPDATETAEEVERAFTDKFVMPVQLGGKHSQGSLLARDQDTGNVWLLKPGSGGQTPAAGAKEDPSTQSRREAAFYHVADAWHLGDFLPHTDLILIDGREYAAIHLLPWSFQTLDQLKEEDPGIGQKVLKPYLHNGTLHRWAVLDYVLGNPDRHAQNLMVHEGEVKLIDHGSAMAGQGFDPAHDRYSFTPYYLRAWSEVKFSTLAADDKLKYMPRVSRETEEQIRTWLDGLHAEDLDKVLLRYGVNPAPAKERLARLKIMASQEPVDLAINKAWVET